MTNGISDSEPASQTGRPWLFAAFAPALVPITWWIWGIFALVVAIRTALHPEKNSVSACYRGACAAWWNGREMYDDMWNGFIYLPHAAIAYTPFYALPLWLGESLYRVLIIALTAWSVWRITRLVSGQRWNEYFFAVSGITIGVGAGNAINGQYNLPLAATLILATCCLLERRWWFAAIWLTISLLLKPIAVAPVLLALALYRPLWWRLPAVMLAVFFVPFFFSLRDLNYAFAEYQTFWETVVRATKPLERRFAEFSTVLWWFGGIDLADRQRAACRAAAALVTLGLGWMALRRHGAARGGLILWALGVTYLMLFNPRTEGLTYVLMAPALALFGGMEFTGARSPVWRRAVGLILLLLGILMTFVHELMPRSGPYFEVAQGSKDLLVRPLIALVFFGWLAFVTLFDGPSTERATDDRAASTPVARSSPSPSS